MAGNVHDVHNARERSPSTEPPSPSLYIESPSYEHFRSAWVRIVMSTQEDSFGELHEFVANGGLEARLHDLHQATLRAVRARGSELADAALAEDLRTKTQDELRAIIANHAVAPPMVVDELKARADRQTAREAIIQGRSPVGYEVLAFRLNHRYPIWNEGFNS